MSDSPQVTDNTVEDEEDEMTLGVFREKTKDLPDSTPLILTTVIPTEDEDGNSSEDDDDEEPEFTTAPVLGIEIEEYDDDSTPPKTVKMVAIVAHMDDITADLEDDEEDQEEDEPTEPASST